MISRRNIREKVMQTLYALDTEQSIEIANYEKALLDKINRTSNSFTASLLYIAKVAQYAETDANNKATKLLPNKSDYCVSIKIAKNYYLLELLNNKSFNEKIKKDNIDKYVDNDWVRKLYLKVIQSERYKNYINEESREDNLEKKMLNYLWKNIINKEHNFQDILADEWPGYEEDRAVVRTMIDFYFKESQEFNFLQFINKEKEDFGKSLLGIVIEKDEYLHSLILPMLNNWDSDRVALIDMILLKMGVAELLYFPTIPTKVTINEYIDIAKDYSTDDSSRFVNGVLDNILKHKNIKSIIKKTV